MKDIKAMTIEELQLQAYLFNVSILSKEAIDELARRNALLVDYLTKQSPGESPCDCCIDHNGIWWPECQCGNSDESGRADVWCSKKNEWQRIVPLIAAAKGEE